MQVPVGETLSKIYKLENGSAQGSILPPLLFLIMINEMPKELFDVESSLFGNDSAILKSCKNLTYISNAIETNLNKIAEGVISRALKSLLINLSVLFSQENAQN